MEKFISGFRQMRRTSGNSVKTLTNLPQTVRTLSPMQLLGTIRACKEILRDKIPLARSNNLPHFDRFYVGQHCAIDGLSGPSE